MESYGLQQVPVLIIDRLPRQNGSSSHHTRRSSAAAEPMYVNHRKRLRYPLRTLVCSEQKSPCPGREPKRELHVLLTSLYKQNQSGQNVSNSEWHGCLGSLSPMNMRTEEKRMQSLSPIEPQHGRLLKAGLKPLRPVNVQGPTVAMCRGMLPERMQVNPAVDGLTRIKRQMVSGQSHPRTSGIPHSRTLVSSAGPKVNRSEDSS